MPKQKLHAVIGVWHEGAVTYYVRRSHKMAYYPGVWSLLSIRYTPRELTSPENLTQVSTLMQRMSNERLGNVPVVVQNYLISGDSDQNPYGIHVYLHLYQIEAAREPTLNSTYYTEGSWLSTLEYEQKSARQACGLCLRLWSDYAWLAGITDRPFVAHINEGKKLTV